jgi:outer membrane protein TolC
MGRTIVPTVVAVGILAFLAGLPAACAQNAGSGWQPIVAPAPAALPPSATPPLVNPPAPSAQNAVAGWQRINSPGPAAPPPSAVPPLVNPPAVAAPPPSAAPPVVNPPAPAVLPPPRKVPSPRDPTGLGLAQPQEAEQALPINLATALRLADARPLVIEAARAAVETQMGVYKQARVLWLPTVYVGFDYQRQDGSQQNALTGGPLIGPRDQFFAGTGARAVFATTDAIYAPLAERQVLRSRNIDVQTAKNEAVLSVALAYFDVQQARGILAGTLDSVAKARELAERIAALAQGLAPSIEVDRALATLAELEQQEATARQDWRFNSASLTRVLRLNPASVVVPLEPPHLQVVLIAPKETVETLVPIGLTNRPELASQQAIVQATLARLKQERMRPLIPSIVLQSNATPGETLGVGAFGTGSNSLNSWSSRSSWDAEVVWEFKNLGFGNRGLIEQRRGEQRLADVELFRIQDQVAAEVAQAQALVEAAAVRVVKAEAGLKAAVVSYAGNLKGLSETVRAGDLLILINRPQEVVAALQQLQQAYINYYTSANDFSRAEFRLFRALGYPAQVIACSESLGPQTTVDTTRPPQLPPVRAPQPCENCPR